MLTGLLIHINYYFRLSRRKNKLLNFLNFIFMGCCKSIRPGQSAILKIKSPKERTTGFFSFTPDNKD